MKRARELVKLSQTLAATANDEQLDPRNLNMLDRQDTSHATSRETEEQDPIFDTRVGPLYLKWKKLSNYRRGS